MKAVSRGDKPLPLKTLRLVSLAVTVATLAVFSSIGYSLAREGEYLTEVLAGDLPLRIGAREGKLGVTIALPIENRGVYPLSVGFAAQVFVEGKLVSRGEQGEVRLLPNERGMLNTSITVPLTELLEDPQIRQALRSGGGNVTFVLTLKFGLEPLVAMSANISIQQRLESFLDIFPGLKLQAPSAEQLSNPSPIRSSLRNSIFDREADTSLYPP